MSGLLEDDFFVGQSIQDEGNGKYGFLIERFNYDGSPDISFNNNAAQSILYFSDDPLTFVSFIKQGEKVLVGGNSGAGFAIARYNTDGTAELIRGLPGMVYRRSTIIGWQKWR